MARRLLLLCSSLGSVSAYANCPVTGKHISEEQYNSDAPSNLHFGGQRIATTDEAAANRLRAALSYYIDTFGNVTQPTYHPTPDLSGSRVTGPVSGTQFVVPHSGPHREDVVQFLHGQALFFSDKFNVIDFLASPSKYLSAPPSMRMGPPHGSNSTGRCPVSGDAINITVSTPSLEFKNGQKLWFVSLSAATAYRAAPRDYWLGPHDLPEPGMDGMRGLPDLRGQILHCPRSGEALNVSMQTPRVMMKHGQAVYFCCHGCVTAFWRDPASLFA